MSARDEDARWLVETETLRGAFRAEELQPVREEPGRAEYEGPVRLELELSSSRPELQLNVRGMRLEEALSRLEQQIDGAVLGGMHVFSVIHGKGEGVLRRGIHEYLKRNSFVEEFSHAPADEGGFGATVVRLAE